MLLHVLHTDPKTMQQTEFSLNGAELSLNSVNSANWENLRNHWSMNWVQYKDLLCYLCLCGLVVSSLSLTWEILGSNPTMLIFCFIYFSCDWIQRIQWKHLEKTPLSPNIYHLRMVVFKCSKLRCSKNIRLAVPVYPCRTAPHPPPPPPMKWRTCTVT